MNRQKLQSDQDLEKARKNNRFYRQEDLHDTIHTIHVNTVKYAPWAFLALFILALFQPSCINLTLVDRALFGVGGALFSTLLSRIQESTL
jgi:hypothetical protein